MTRILLARHGETDHNRNGIIQGSLDVDLNDTGIEQAQRLADRLQDHDIDAVYASNLQRTRRTAEIIAGPHGLAVQTIADLNERSYGDLEGKPSEALQEQFEAADTPWHAWEPETAESTDDVMRRAIPALEQIRANHADETVVVVAHGQVNRSVLARLVGADAGYGHVIQQDNACLNELAYEEYCGWRITRINDVSHLEKTERMEHT